MCPSSYLIQQVRYGKQFQKSKSENLRAKNIKEQSPTFNYAKNKNY